MSPYLKALAIAFGLIGAYLALLPLIV